MKGNGMAAKEVGKWRHQGTCCVCHKTTDWECPECKMYAGSSVWLCPDKTCRKAHDTDCSLFIAAN